MFSCGLLNSVFVCVLLLRFNSCSSAFSCGSLNSVFVCVLLRLVRTLCSSVVLLRLVDFVFACVFLLVCLSLGLSVFLLRLVELCVCLCSSAALTLCSRVAFYAQLSVWRLSNRSCRSSFPSSTKRNGRGRHRAAARRSTSRASRDHRRQRRIHGRHARGAGADARRTPHVSVIHADGIAARDTPCGLGSDALAGTVVAIQDADSRAGSGAAHRPREPRCSVAKRT